MSFKQEKQSPDGGKDGSKDDNKQVPTAENIKSESNPKVEENSNKIQNNENNVKVKNQELLSSNNNIKQESSSNNISMQYNDNNISTKGLKVEEDDDEEEESSISNGNESKVDENNSVQGSSSRIIDIKLGPQEYVSTVPTVPTNPLSNAGSPKTQPTKPPIRSSPLQDPYKRQHKKMKPNIINDEESLRIKQELLYGDNNDHNDNSSTNLFGSPIRFPQFNMPNLEQGTNEFTQDQEMINNSFGNNSRSPRKRSLSITPPNQVHSVPKSAPNTRQNILNQEIIYPHSRKDSALLEKGVAYWFNKNVVKEFMEKANGDQLYGLINALKASKISRNMVSKEIKTVLNTVPIRLSRDIVLGYVQQHSKTAKWNKENGSKSNMKLLQETRTQKNVLKESIKEKNAMIKDLSAQVDSTRDLCQLKDKAIDEYKGKLEAAKKETEEAMKLAKENETKLRREIQSLEDRKRNENNKHEEAIEKLKKHHERQINKYKKDIDKLKIKHQKEINNLDSEKMQLEHQVISDPLEKENKLRDQNTKLINELSDVKLQAAKLQQDNERMRNLYKGEKKKMEEKCESYSNNIKQEVKKQVENIQERYMHQDRIKDQQVAVANNKERAARREVAELRRELNIMKNVKSQLEKEVDSYKTELDFINSAPDQAPSQAPNSKKEKFGQLLKIREEMKNKDNQISQLKDVIGDKKDYIQRLNEDVQVAKDDYNVLHTKYKSVVKDLKGAEEAMKVANNKLKQQVDKSNRLKLQAKSLQSSLERHQQNLNPDERREEYDLRKLEIEITNLKQQNTKLASEVSSMQGLNTTLLQQIDEMNSQDRYETKEEYIDEMDDGDDDQNATVPTRYIIGEWRKLIKAIQVMHESLDEKQDVIIDLIKSKGTSNMSTNNKQFISDYIRQYTSVTEDEALRNISRERYLTNVLKDPDQYQARDLKTENTSQLLRNPTQEKPGVQMKLQAYTDVINTNNVVKESLEPIVDVNKMMSCTADPKTQSVLFAQPPPPKVVKNDVPLFERLMGYSYGGLHNNHSNSTNSNNNNNHSKSKNNKNKRKHKNKKNKKKNVGNDDKEVDIEHVEFSEPDDYAPITFKHTGQSDYYMHQAHQQQQAPIPQGQQLAPNQQYFQQMVQQSTLTNQNLLLLMNSQVTDKLNDKRSKKHKAQSIKYNGRKLREAVYFFYKVEDHFRKIREPESKYFEDLVETFMEDPLRRWARRELREIGQGATFTEKWRKLWTRYFKKYVPPSVYRMLWDDMTNLLDPNPYEHRTKWREIKKVFIFTKSFIDTHFGRGIFLKAPDMKNDVLIMKKLFSIWPNKRMIKQIRLKLQLVALVPYTIEDFFQDMIDEFEYLRRDSILLTFPGLAPSRITKESETDPYTASALAKLTKPAPELRDQAWLINPWKDLGRTNGKQGNAKQTTKKPITSDKSNKGRNSKQNFQKGGRKGQRKKGYKKGYKNNFKRFENQPMTKKIYKKIKKLNKKRYKKKYKHPNGSKGRKASKSNPQRNAKGQFTKGNPMKFQNGKKVGYQCSICVGKGITGPQASHNIKECKDYDPNYYQKNPQKSKFKTKGKFGNQYLFADDGINQPLLEGIPEVEIHDDSPPEQSEDENIPNEPNSEQQDQKDDEKDDEKDQNNNDDVNDGNEVPNNVPHDEQDEDGYEGDTSDSSSSTTETSSDEEDYEDESTSTSTSSSDYDGEDENEDEPSQPVNVRPDNFSYIQENDDNQFNYNTITPSQKAQYDEIGFNPSVIQQRLRMCSSSYMHQMVHSSSDDEEKELLADIGDSTRRENAPLLVNNNSGSNDDFKMNAGTYQHTVTHGFDFIRMTPDQSIEVVFDESEDGYEGDHDEVCDKKEEPNDPPSSYSTQYSEEEKQHVLEGEISTKGEFDVDTTKGHYAPVISSDVDPWNFESIEGTKDVPPYAGELLPLPDSSSETKCDEADEDPSKCICKCNSKDTLGLPVCHSRPITTPESNDVEVKIDHDTSTYPTEVWLDEHPRDPTIVPKKEVVTKEITSLMRLFDNSVRRNDSIADTADNLIQENQVILDVLEDELNNPVTVSTDVSTIIGQELHHWNPMKYCKITTLAVIFIIMLGVILIECFGISVCQTLCILLLLVVLTLIMYCMVTKLIEKCKIMACPRNIHQVPTTFAGTN